VSAVVADHVTKRYGPLVAVDDLSFEVPAGQLLAVLGPNGAGKTTTLEMLEGFIVPTSGTVRVLGAYPRRGGRSWRARIGLVLQSTSLDAEVTVRDTLALYAQLYPSPRPVREVLDLVDLADDAQTRVAGSTWPSASSGSLRSCSWTSRAPGWIPRRGGAPGGPSRTSWPTGPR
jgi:ABC-2 type transport system ATP-binding protein